jgi:hypothetical protein
MADISNEQLLAEVEDLIRTMPPLQQANEETLSWLGRAAAVIHQWDMAQAIAFDGAVRALGALNVLDKLRGEQGIVTMLHRARHDLRMQTIGPATIVVGQGAVFDYFDEVRRIVEAAESDILFVDPYLDAEFVSRYLPHVAAGVLVRLLARERIATLLPAAALIRQQKSQSVEVRSAPQFHDRYVFVDRRECYQSGASFKDGAKTAPTTLTQIVDAFAEVHGVYETIWDSATLHS